MLTYGNYDYFSKSSWRALGSLSHARGIGEVTKNRNIKDTTTLSYIYSNNGNESSLCLIDQKTEYTILLNLLLIP
mgnify:CR=1 FL=1